MAIAGNGFASAKRIWSTWQLKKPEQQSRPVRFGKGCLAETHGLALGEYGTFGTPLANAEVGTADVVLVVSSKLAEHNTVFETPKLPDPRRQTVIQIDIEPKNAS